MTMPKADGLIPSVSAASIIAKVARDQFMAEQDAVYPGYGFKSNAGYGVAKHRAAIERLGVTPLHRLSFAPLAKYAVTPRAVPQKKSGQLYVGPEIFLGIPERYDESFGEKLAAPSSSDVSPTNTAYPNQSLALLPAAAPPSRARHTKIVRHQPAHSESFLASQTLTPALPLDLAVAPPIRGEPSRLQEVLAFMPPTERSNA